MTKESLIAEWKATRNQGPPKTPAEARARLDNPLLSAKFKEVLGRVIDEWEEQIESDRLRLRPLD